MAVVITVVVVVSEIRQTAMTSMNTIFHFPDQRKLITEQLESKPGRHLVLVSYDLEWHCPGNELVHNGLSSVPRKILWAQSKWS
jgi:hypothetical protein